MNEIAKNCKILPFLVVLLFFGEGLSFARISSAFVTKGVSSSASIAMTRMSMSNAGNSDEAEKDSMKTAPVRVPLIDIGTSDPNDGDKSSSPATTETSRALVSALQTSGFAIVRSPLLTKELQSKALASASSFLAAPKTASVSSSGNKETQKPLVEAIDHPTDPKAYSMLDSDEQLDFVTPDHTLKDYVSVLRSIKRQVLRLIAMGLGMTDPNFFANLHDEDNDTLRLILYHPTHSKDTGNRCKEHSDYGTITLLSTDGVSGLELFHEGNWLPVPYVEGALVVNVGSLLSGWTRGSLRATLHRVAGPASQNSCSDPKILLDAVQRPRTSLAFFADPNKDVSESLQATAKATNNDDDDSTHRLTETLGGLSVAEYIAWRSGGDGADRSGISFTANESERIDNDNKTS